MSRLQLQVSGKVLPQKAAFALASVLEINETTPVAIEAKQEGKTRYETTIPQFRLMTGVFKNGDSIYQMAYEGKTIISELKTVSVAAQPATSVQVWQHTFVMQRVGIPLSGAENRLMIESTCTATFQLHCYYANKDLPKHVAELVAVATSKPLDRDLYQSSEVEWPHKTHAHSVHAMAVRYAAPTKFADSREIIEGVWSNYAFESDMFKRKFQMEVYALDTLGNTI